MFIIFCLYICVNREYAFIWLFAVNYFMMKNFFLSILLAVLSLHPLMAQNKNTARKLFLEGEYAEAKPMFEKLLQRNPRNGELNYWYAVCCYDIKPMLSFAASRKITNAYRYLGDICADSALYADAAEQYETFLSLCKDDSLAALYKAKLSNVNRLNRMVNTTEKVCVIDSFVVDNRNYTETLARIYLKQRRYSKALEIIRSLYLNFPNKNIYFADQIRFLEILVRINQNK